ncbi:glucose dehydrogenase [FAD, quinone]-like [Anthonomus grandis grandis]|uniref:glucose dehydrogenase [FAD, quinone]-like n=1 Tax=Anthonomus grandis grandis TaxID=2921223 RepID=UPI0021668DF3|nr:glucose dehydrogenase [FAD, quinone]-like [Anthonomus grandis grandis]
MNIKIPLLALIFILILSLNLVETTHFSNFAQFLSEINETLNQASSYELPTNNNEYFMSQSDNHEKTKDFGTYDFVIVGAGAAGGVLANRLSETNYSVLIIEAGKEDPAISKVLGLSLFLLKSDWNWGYNTIVQKNSCLGSINQKCMYPRGKSLGGSSAINIGFYSRGNKENYNVWEELVNSKWSYENCLPYFKKSETADFNVDIDNVYHGFNGPQNISIVEDTPILSNELINAFKELGMNEGDYNGASQYVVSRCQMFLDGTTRSSSAHAYIRPALNRNNLKLSLNSLVTKILISEDKRATGVEFWKNGEKNCATARKEVIVSAGAINSPQLLMLSGIGPQDELKKHGIKMLVNSNAVGKNLRDHMWYYGIVFRTNITIPYNNSLVENIKLWNQKKRPLITSAGVQVVTYYNIGDNRNFSDPNIEVIILGPPAVSPDLPKMLGLNQDYQMSFKNLNNQTDIISGLFLLQPKSIGQITLKSADPKDFPLIDTNFFSDPEDLETMYNGIEKILELQNTETFKKMGVKLIRNSSPSCDGLYETFSKEWWICDLQYVGTTVYHPSGTTQMGNNITNAVVNDNLEVYGIKQLRVVDAGVLPVSISGHLNAPVVMIAEKIADVIKAKYQ